MLTWYLFNFTKSVTDPVSQNTSMGVDTLVSLILSYFCFLVPAFSPCQGRLKKKSVRKKANREEKLW